MAFGLSTSYCGVWFVVDMLRHCVFRCLVFMLYLCGRNSNRQNGFDQSKILYYAINFNNENLTKFFMPSAFKKTTDYLIFTLCC